MSEIFRDGDVQKVEKLICPDQKCQKMIRGRFKNVIKCNFFFGILVY